MNKKQKNRKIVTQNNRNRMINRRYISTIKTLPIVKVSIILYLAGFGFPGNGVGGGESAVFG